MPTFTILIKVKITRGAEIFVTSNVYSKSKLGITYGYALDIYEWDNNLWTDILVVWQFFDRGKRNFISNSIMCTGYM